ncbi:MAG: GDP-mannose 4,6-dehydratase [Kiritimatiellia bacterium]|nr:GDP-mannose 4,6-dehydratase [Kiritimatiellia bacterium]
MSPNDDNGNRWAEALQGTRVLITGGLGMIGSTIAHKLVRVGAKVTLVDACIEPYGANEFNIQGIADAVNISVTDIRDKEAIKHLVRGQNVIFNLAGQISHNDSMQDPFLDADINYIGHLNVLENVRMFNPEAVILFSGSRLQYGRIESNPVNENHPMRPRTPYALNKAAAENMYMFYHAIHGTRSVALRISNPYGPRSQMKHSKYSIINWFIRQAMENKTIPVFGDGAQMRDYIYVDDLADVFIAAAARSECIGQVFNVGSGVGARFRDMVETVVQVVGSGRVETVPWPDDYINVETGDYIADIGKITRTTGWYPRVNLTEGVARTVEYYRKHGARYWS